MFSALGPLYGLCVVSYAPTHLLLTALQMNNSYYWPGSL